VTHYRREIDGLRAIAVGPVILFHAGLPGFRGGYVGVDVFFVISGYLITSVLLGELAAGTFSLTRFYERRARRLLPALFTVMAFCVPAAWLWLLPPDIKDLSESLAYVSVFTSNVLFSGQSGYFDTAAELKPLLHTWSLGVEEQFYLFFPLLLLLVWRAARPGLAAVIAALGAASLYQSVTRVHDTAAVYLLTTRGWELAIGALIALPAGGTALTGRRVLRDVAAAAGAVMVLYAVFVFTEETPFPGAAALIPTAGTALILLCGAPDTVTGRLLASRPLVDIGLISYSAYLWHQPLLAFARQARPEGLTTGSLVALAAASLVVAYGSWRFVEQPFRRPDLVSRRQMFGLAVTGSLAFAALGIAGTRSDGFVDAYVAHKLTDDEREFYRLIQLHTNVDPYAVMIDDGACRFWSMTVTPEFERRLSACRERFGPALVVLGDSHAMNVYNILVRANVRPFVAGLVQAGCRPHRNDRACQYDGFDDLARRRRDDIGTVIFHQSGSYLLQDVTGRVDSDRAFERDAPYRLDRDNLAGIVAYLTRLQASVDTVWLGPFTEGRQDFRNMRVLRGGPAVQEQSLRQFAALDRDLQQQASAGRWPFRYVSLVALLGIGRESMQVGSCLIFRNADHFSVCGETWAATPIKQAFDRGLFAPRPLSGNAAAAAPCVPAAGADPSRSSSCPP
jgi:peptidoglycan/LPS O-acetylase OafA/YrhL